MREPRLRGGLRRAGIRALGIAHRTVLRASGGRLLASAAGMPVLLLTTTGVRTGKQRTTPLTFIRDGDRLVVVASYGGSDRSPGWWLNLQRNPQAVVTVAGVEVAVTARAASREERERLWPKVTSTYSGYARYERRTVRELAVILLTPARAGDGGGRGRSGEATGQRSPGLESTPASGS